MKKITKVGKLMIIKWFNSLINQAVLGRGFPLSPRVECCGRWRPDECLSFGKILNHSRIGNSPISHPPSNTRWCLEWGHFQSSAPSYGHSLFSTNFDTFGFGNRSCRNLDSCRSPSCQPFHFLGTSWQRDLTKSRSSCWFHDDWWSFGKSYRIV